MWATDGDYSAWHTSVGGYDNIEPQLYETVGEVQDFISAVAVRNPDMVTKVFEVAGELDVKIEFTDPRIEITKNGMHPYDADKRNK